MRLLVCCSLLLPAFVAPFCGASSLRGCSNAALAIVGDGSLAARRCLRLHGAQVGSSSTFNNQGAPLRNLDSVLSNDALPDEPPVAPGPPLASVSPKLYYKWENSGLKLNLFGAYYGFVAISLGLLWWLALKSITAVDNVAKLCNRDVDINKGWGIRANAVWGWCVLKMTGCYPTITGKRRVATILRTLRKERGSDAGVGVMYVANHSSWMDIPYVAMAIGVRENYKVSSERVGVVCLPLPWFSHFSFEYSCCAAAKHNRACAHIHLINTAAAADCRKVGTPQSSNPFLCHSNRLEYNG